MSAQNNRAAWFQGGDAECDVKPGARQRAFRLVLLGPPGVGKGTQAELLCHSLGTCHLSTGDVFRAASCQHEPSPALKSALDAMKRGELVSDGLVVTMVEERSGCLACCGGFLLDGFPRTVAQAEALDELLQGQGVALDGVLSYDLPLAEIVDRLSGRRTCSKCKAVYHVTARPPHKEGICDLCGNALIQREDDRPEAIRVRMQAYEESTRPLADYYARTDRLLSVPAEGSPEAILERSLRELQEQSVKARH
ncbi:adenylate kinase family protein [Paludisphaera mucosa]|uniref:Adenylate kinase n=1 Tax=Paludisphaera mucosa TaxID=3030827 RepID=A0ABT6F3R5_9BACT|nr:nucleoside monophosphate kinase [Paludisphaera mucosa]MDG3002217.1 nucleoside monophosphate kinase [Paludisphaera mucosa]